MKKDISATKMASCLLGIGLMLTGYSCTDSNFEAHPIYLGESFLILYKIYTFVP